MMPEGWKTVNAGEFGMLGHIWIDRLPDDVRHAVLDELQSDPYVVAMIDSLAWRMLHRTLTGLTFVPMEEEDEELLAETPSPR